MVTIKIVLKFFFWSPENIILSPLFVAPSKNSASFSFAGAFTWSGRDTKSYQHQLMMFPWTWGLYCKSIRTHCDITKSWLSELFFSSSAKMGQAKEATDGVSFFMGRSLTNCGWIDVCCSTWDLKLMESSSSSTFQLTLSFFLSHCQDPTLISCISSPTFGLLRLFHAALFCPFQVGTKKIPHQLSNSQENTFRFCFTPAFRDDSRQQWLIASLPFHFTAAVTRVNRFCGGGGGWVVFA